MRGEDGKETPKKRDGFRLIFMTSHMTLFVSYLIPEISSQERKEIEQ